MSLATIRTAIKTDLESVSGIGPVHEYIRLAKDWGTVLARFKDSHNKINSWMITREATPGEEDTRDSFERIHHMKLIGVYGVQDSAATELTFQDLVEAIVAALHADTELGGTTYRSGPVQVATVEHRMFGAVLCHYAELRVDVWEQALISA